MKALKTCKTGCGKMQSGGPVKKVKKMAQGGAMNKPQIYGIPQTGTTNYSAPTMKKGGVATNRAVSPGCRNGMVKDASGKCVMERKFKSGGATTKTKKFAALAPPYNKATFADKIVGAKKKIVGAIRKKK